ncbi:MAG TPA: SRPBCC domain-containing protein [Bacteroidia bacterium]|nr:SRPBCC domain-containing protein [Bacteroidia bacterium]
MYKPIEHTVTIKAKPFVVWNALTEPGQMKHWMAEPEMQLEIESERKLNGTITMHWFHHIRATNKGTVLAFKPNKIFKYNYLSSISRLTDKPENYSAIEFKLQPAGSDTLLTVIATGFPNETTYKHLEFYWRGTIVLLKNWVEKQG